MVDYKIDFQLRQAVEQNHLLDWLELHSNVHKLAKNDADYKEYDPELDFLRFIGKQKAIFIDKLQQFWLDKLLSIQKNWENYEEKPDSKYHQAPIAAIRLHNKWPPEKKDFPDPSKPLDVAMQTWHEQTLYAMEAGIPIIIRPFLLDTKTDPDNPMIILPTALVRRDVLPRLFENVEHLGIVKDRIKNLESKDEKEGKGHEKKYDIVTIRFAILKLKNFSIDPNPKSIKDDPDNLSRHPNITGLQLTNTADLIWYRSLAVMQKTAFQSYGHKCRVYMMGRGYNLKKEKNKNAVDTIVGLDDGENRDTVLSRIEQAHEWWLNVRSDEAKQWRVFPKPNNQFLWPNMKSCMGDGIWSNAKHQIADDIKELTKLWYVTYEMRVDCHANHGVYNYEDPRFHIGMLPIKGVRQQTLDEIIKMNRKCTPPRLSKESAAPLESEVEENEGVPPVKPWTRKSSIIRTEAETKFIWPPDLPSVSMKKWKKPPKHWMDQMESLNFMGLEESKRRRFFQYPVWTDFENTSTIADDLSKFPMINDLTRVPLFECSVYDYSKKRDVEKRFCARTGAGPTSIDDEINAFFEWFSFIEQMRIASGFIPTEEDTKKYGGKLYIISHWSPAEPSLMQTSFNSVMKRLRGAGLDEKDPRRIKLEQVMDQIEWFDLCKFMRDECWIARGCLNFGLKSVARAMHGYGMIDQIWPKHQIADGMSAMIGLILDSRQQYEAETKIRKSALYAQMRNNQIPRLSDSKHASALGAYLSIDVKTLREIERVCIRQM